MAQKRAGQGPVSYTHMMSSAYMARSTVKTAEDSLMPRPRTTPVATGVTHSTKSARMTMTPRRRELGRWGSLWASMNTGMVRVTTIWMAQRAESRLAINRAMLIGGRPGSR